MKYVEERGGVEVFICLKIHQDRSMNGVRVRAMSVWGLIVLCV